VLFVITCTDKPNSLDLRLKTRPEHIAFLESLNIKAAGPFLDADEKPIGSLIILEAENLAAAKAIAARDPYANAGLFQTTEVRAWRWAINNPETV
jgi:uncharacterized protein